MAYENYKTPGTAGWWLYHFSQIGIPINVVEMLTFRSTTVSYCGEVFATIKAQGQVPLIVFVGREGAYWQNRFNEYLYNNYIK